MIQTLFTSPLVFFVSAIGLIMALSVHEFSHALVADRLGDPTPRSQGRLTLNPLKHLDPIGTLLLFLVGFGWGKPVMFDPYNLKNPRQDAALISIAGPISNLLMALLFSIVGKALLGEYFAFLVPFIYTNIVLAIFNLVPIGPLDGQKIVLGLLPRDLAYEFEMIMSRYGTLILLLLILPVFGTSPITALIDPVITYIAHFLI